MLRVKLNVYNVDVLTIVDSGSSISLIKAEIVPESVNTILDKTISVKGLYGHTRELNKTVLVSLKLNETKEIKFKAFVMEDMRFPLIIGNDVMQTFDVIIDYKRQIVILEGVQCPFDLTHETLLADEMLNGSIGVITENTLFTDIYSEQINNELSKNEASILADLLKEYNDIFSHNGEIGCVESEACRIQLIDGAKPVKQNPYRTSAYEREFIKKQVEEMLDKGIIRPSTSPWSSNVVLVKSGHRGSSEPRFAVDFRRLNALTVCDSYPIPQTATILDELGGKCYFTSLDLARGFWQIELLEESRPLTAFSCCVGLYEWCRLPFGLRNSSSIFQRTIDIKMSDLLFQIMLAYIDDLVVYSDNFEDHVRRLRIVFERIKQVGFKLKVSKCFFGQTKIDCLGFVVSKEGLVPSNKKIQAIVEMKPPTNIKQVRSFLGLCSFFRRFVPHFSKIAKPINNLLEIGIEFNREEEQQKAFEILKAKLANPPVLAHFDQHKDAILHIDASAYGICGALCQLHEGKLKREH